MNFLNEHELKSVHQACEIGEQWGYGNIIDRPKAAWALSLIQKYESMSLEGSLRGARWDDERVERLKKIPKEEVIKLLKEYIGEEQ